jgi:glycosyltransferase involved in cell wall biosynthesis
VAKISAVITCKNEGKIIQQCLESIKWVDEIVVVDNQSTDNTIEICRQYTDKIFVSDDLIIGARINYGIEQSSSEWVLNIDADEEVTEELKQEILSAIEIKEYNGFKIPFKQKFLEKWIKHGGWYPSYIPRLYRRDKARYTRRYEHILINIDGRIGYLKNAMLHHGMGDTIQHYIEKGNFYTDNIARERFNEKKRVSIIRLGLRPFYIFVKRYIIWRGFLDGKEGFVLNFLWSFFCFWEEAKLYQIYKREKIIGINTRYLQSVITGIESYVLNLVKAIEKIEKQKKYVLFQCEKDIINKVTDSANITYYQSKFPTKITFFRILWEQFLLPRDIWKNKCKLFHGPAFVVPIIKACKYIITIHDLSWIYYPESFTFLNRLYFKVFLPLSIKRADKIIVDSDSTKRDLIKEFNIKEEVIKRVYLGVNENFKTINDSVKLNEIKNKYKLPDKFILAISTLLPRKNFEGIIKAFSKVHSDIDCKLVIVGKKGWLYDNIFKTVKDFNLKDNIIFTGYVPDDDLVYLYNLAELFVLPSFYEGFGLPLLEAMACGCPVLASNVSSIPEVVGDAACLVDPYNIEAISAGIKNVLKDGDLRKSMIEKGFKQSKKFSWEKCAKETIAVYEELLNA